MKRLISATITPEAQAIYEDWARTRSASRRISEAIVETRNHQVRLDALDRRITCLREQAEGLVELLALTTALGMSTREAMECVRTFRHRNQLESIGDVLRQDFEWDDCMSFAEMRWNDPDDVLKYLRTIEYAEGDE